MAKMSKATLDHLKDLLEVYKKTGKKELLVEIKAIFENHKDDPDVHTLRRSAGL
jgi:hypothetical protein